MGLPYWGSQLCAECNYHMEEIIEHTIEEQGKETPMLLIWGYVLLSLVIVAGTTYTIEKYRLVHAETLSQQQYQKLDDERAKIEDYRRYLEKNGNVHAEEYFTNPSTRI